ncbi:acetaldehyde dehydrogenase [Lysinibacillus sp. KCTC 33748]|uniref:aldehyde dehydrogenase family protein n=1 Tax=unclassified Lysinibacillus TaxID=2636778 RepID=UPI0009A639AD|nr:MULTISPECIES: aldehyde dehydrogenase family protein [unclassified Lysinibacillus]OXS76144.1 acetaldehyde dehydrogenase [Lysinibacillus sp. KCTC 33748]SKB41263.1 acetaldehyde dehydrogenase [Lysinibacillus sp. AC-3]
MATFDKDLLAIQEMRDAVRHANIAQATYMQYSQQQVDHIVKAVADAAFKEAERLANMAVQETGMGVPNHKKMKNEVASRDVYEDIKDLKTVGVVGFDRMKKVTEIASPFGVIAGIVPTTNPTSTAIFKTLISLKTRNGLVLSPHPYAVECTKEALEICRVAAEKAGAPEGLLHCLTLSSMEATQQLMKHPDIHLILATGGGALVKAAYSSGKPAYGVGPGNVPAYIEKSANISKAVRQLVQSKSFDNGTICATEQSIIVDKVIAEQVLSELKKNGAYILSDEEKVKMEKLISPIPGKVNPQIVGKSAACLADSIGVTVPEDTKVLVGMETMIGKNIPFSLEKLSPIFALYTVEDSTEAKQVMIDLLNIGGRGHTCSIHTENTALAEQFSIELPVSRIVINTLSSIGAVGGTTGLAPSFTLGCGTFGGNITSDNITARHLLNIKRMAYGIKDVEVPKPKFLTKPVVENIKAQDPSLDTAVVQQIVDQVLKQITLQNK